MRNKTKIKTKDNIRGICTNWTL